MNELEEIASDLQQKYPKMQIEITDDGRLLINTKGSNKENIEIKSLGLLLNGEIIIIDKSVKLDKDGTMFINYKIFIEDNLHLSTYSPRSVKNTVKSGVETLYTNDIYYVKSSMDSNHVIMRLDITYSSKGDILAKMAISYENKTDKAPDYLARIDYFGKTIFGSKWSIPSYPIIGRAGTKTITLETELAATIDLKNRAKITFDSRRYEPSELLNLRFDCAFIILEIGGAQK